MSLMELTQVLGNVGEFVGAVGVVVTLLFLAVQVRHGKLSTDANTEALEQNRRLAQAQTYQARAETRITQLQLEAESQYIAPILDKLERANWNRHDNPDALDALEPVERRRLIAWLTMGQRQFDNYHYQYQQGFIDEEYWQNVMLPGMRFSAPGWRAIPETGYRPSFRELVDELSMETEG